MFDSGISAKTLIESVKEEADIAPSISDSHYVMWLNALEQLLYTEIIREQGQLVFGVSVLNHATEELPVIGIGKNNVLNLYDNSPIVTIKSLKVPTGEAALRFEDIYAVYAGQIQLIRSSVMSGAVFSDSYYKIQNNIGLHITGWPNEWAKQLKFIYFVRPALKQAEEDLSEQNVMLPVEFIDLAAAKLRGEAYKLANEDTLSAKWLNDYNVLLETFKAWMAAKQSEFGL